MERDALRSSSNALAAQYDEASDLVSKMEVEREETDILLKTLKNRLASTEKDKREAIKRHQEQVSLSPLSPKRSGGHHLTFDSYRLSASRPSGKHSTTASR